MFNHRQDLQFKTVPEHPDAVYARRLVDVIGSQYGEIGVAMHYMVQPWDMHVPGRYRDLLFGLGTEQVANLEMLATMIAQLLEHAPAAVLDAAVRLDPTVGAVIAGTDLEQAIATGAGAHAGGNPWKGAPSNVSRNLAADFQTNAAAELNRRIQLSQLHRMTDDADIRYLLSFLLARAAANERLCRSVSADLREGAPPQATES